jgi:hypothetical protein
MALGPGILPGRRDLYEAFGPSFRLGSRNPGQGWEPCCRTWATEPTLRKGWRHPESRKVSWCGEALAAPGRQGKQRNRLEARKVANDEMDHSATGQMRERSGLTVLRRSIGSSARRNESKGIFQGTARGCHDRIARPGRVAGDAAVSLRGCRCARRYFGS